MRICHTSDWHLGHLLRGQKRDAEFAAFLDWLIATLRQERVEALLIAGDLFDGATPSHRAQELYYRFLAQVSGTGCRHVVAIGGNHDSPSLLEAPKTLLAALNVRVIGASGDDPADEVVVLKDPTGRPELLVCAVPYLRDRDIRLAEAGESGADKDRKWLEGIFAHYAAVIDLARARRDDLGGTTPVVAMGHLFVAGGRVREGDGVRELYVGSLARVPVDLFPEDVDYVALGHLHQAQKVGPSESRRYSGAPLPLGFGEAGVTKSLCLVDLAPGQRPRVQLVPVPTFQKMARLQGDRTSLLDQLQAHVSTNASIWIELLYTGSEPIGDLRDQLNQRAERSQVVILALRDARLTASLALGADEEGTHLEALTPGEVFLRCLELRRIPDEERPSLIAAHDEILAALLHDDPSSRG